MTTTHIYGGKEQWLLNKMRAHGVPGHMEAGILRYLMHGNRPGDFLLAFLCNNMREAFLRADDINKYRLYNLYAFFRDHTPAECWGDKDTVKAWMDHKGYEGINGSKDE